MRNGIKQTRDEANRIGDGPFPISDGIKQKNLSYCIKEMQQSFNEMAQSFNEMGQIV